MSGSKKVRHLVRVAEGQLVTAVHTAVVPPFEEATRVFLLGVLDRIEDRVTELREKLA